MVYDLYTPFEEPTKMFVAAGDDESGIEGLVREHLRVRPLRATLTP
jgi:hypothetical protein